MPGRGLRFQRLCYQEILIKVREGDPGGDRTLGIITKPDGLPLRFRK
jgi:hypothetical protein